MNPRSILFALAALTLAIAPTLSKEKGVAPRFLKRVRAEFDKAPLCATIGFDDLEVNVLDGVVQQSNEGPNRVRKGDRLKLVDVAVGSRGLRVELEVTSLHTRARGVDIEMVFYRSVRGPKNEFVNLEDFWKAIHHFAEECAPRTENAE